MSLLRLREVLGVAQIALAVAAVVLGGGASTWAVVVLVGLSLLAFVRPLPEEPSAAGQRLWTTLIVVGLIASFARAFLLTQILDAGVDFLLLLVAQRLFQRQKKRQNMQLLLLGTVLMTIAAVINADLNFPILLAAYLPIAILALLVNTLLGEGERLGARVQHDLSRRGLAPIRRLLPSAGLVALVAGISGLVVFLAFPRFGVGVFLRGSLAEKSTTGFSDEVRLGGFGRIKNDATVIMHLDVLDGLDERPNRLNWYLRGSAFDRYDQGMWQHGVQPERHGFDSYGAGWRFFKDQTQPKPQRAGDPVKAEPVPRPGFSGSQRTVRARVTLDEIGTEFIFAASEPLGVGMKPRGPLERSNRLAAAVDRQLRVLDKQPGPIQYEFLSRVAMPTAEELQSVGNPEIPDLLSTYGDPSGGLSDEVTALAQEITAGAQTRYEKVDAVLEYLLALEYSLDQKVSPRVLNGADPVEGFLFDTKSGHCEYFATAMAVLLREVGVPTRNVNGYYGAHWNAVGGFYAVRQANAHSWVEVHFGELGWVTFDPTPPSGRIAGDDAQWFPAMSERLDAVRNAYLTWVIDYNLGRQLQLLQNLGVEARPVTGTVKIEWGRVGLGIGLPFALLAIGVVLARVRRLQAERPEVRLYRQVLGRLARLGHQREPSESPSKFAGRLAETGAPQAEALTAFSRAYEAARFGVGEPGPATLARLRALAKRVR